MPCWTVQTMSVEFSAKHPDLLRKALNDLGLRFDELLKDSVFEISVPPSWGVYNPIRIDLKTGKATLPQELQPTLNKLKQSYTKHALLAAAQKKGWKVMSQGNKGVIRR